MKKKLIAWLCAASLIVCGTVDPSAACAVKKPVSLSKTSLTMKPGASKTLKLKKSAGVKIRSQKFSSTDKKIAAVTKKGKITAKTAGKAVIKVTVKFTSAKVTKKTTLKCNVTVTTKNVTDTVSTASAAPRNNVTKAPGANTTASATPGSKVTNTPEATTKVSAAPGSSNKPETMTTPGSSNSPDSTIVPTESNKPDSTTSL